MPALGPALGSAGPGPGAASGTDGPPGPGFGPSGLPPWAPGPRIRGPRANPQPGSRTRRYYRATDGRLVAGVARGLADHLGVNVVLVRIAFVALTFASGAGVFMYAAFWLFVPQAPLPGVPGQGSAATAATPAAGSGRSRDVGQLIALGSLTLGACLLAQALGLGLGGTLFWPLVIAGLGVVLLWREADELQRRRWRRVATNDSPSGWLRLAAGIALVLAGGGAFLAIRGQLQDAGRVLMATLVVILGLLLIAGPYLLRLVRDLSDERLERIRSQERAEVAAHVHDSVLHTLTLIQRNVDDPREVQRLARSQERELRAWLYKPVADPDATLAAALERVAGEVEDTHSVPIDVVAVGDGPLDEHSGAALQAAREAMVNAAKYSGAPTISVYAEVEPELLTIFVRDRGAGFDPDDLPEDRMGVRQSIIGRMKRNGGSAVIRSTPGEGTEVRLEMPRSDQ
jgi:signal transduction histidine kinase/phage shock protein PspC (stress-responsive transcriptional regulator)